MYLVCSALPRWGLASPMLAVIALSIYPAVMVPDGEASHTLIWPRLCWIVSHHASRCYACRLACGYTSAKVYYARLVCGRQANPLCRNGFRMNS